MSSAVALSMLKTFGALALVLGCFFLLARFLQRMQHGPKGSDQGQMQVMSALAVGNRERVMLIKAKGKVVMLGVSPGRVYPLHVFEAANDNDPQSFSSTLDRADP